MEKTETYHHHCQGVGGGGSGSRIWFDSAARAESHDVGEPLSGPISSPPLVILDVIFFVINHPSLPGWSEVCTCSVP